MARSRHQPDLAKFYRPKAIEVTYTDCFDGFFVCLSTLQAEHYLIKYCFKIIFVIFAPNYAGMPDGNRLNRGYGFSTITLKDI